MGTRYTRREVIGMSLAVAAAGALAGSAVYGKDEVLMKQNDSVGNKAPIGTRFFWNWDHSTEWALNRAGAQTLGASNHYGRTPETFVEDFSKMVKWCGKHSVDGVVVWGLLRDMHGGVESVKKICDAAHANNVKVLCGVGLNCYGGVYYEGESPYSLEKHLQAHPELVGVNEAGYKMAYNFGILGPKITTHACPSRKENQDFMSESLSWLFKNVPIDGVQMETGDTGVCKCKLCTERRANPECGISWDDMALMYPMAGKSIRTEKPDAWIICETYAHPEPYSDKEKQQGFGTGKPSWADKCMEQFPEGTFVQWAGDAFFKPQSARKWTDTGMVTDKRHRHIMRAHFGTYWGGIRGEVSVEYIADMFQQSMAHGIEAISLFGEVSPFNTGAELNYLALQNFGSTANSKADIDLFLKEVAAPLLGGEEAARDYLKYGRLRWEPARIPDALKDIKSRCTSLSPDATRRWTWLANFLASFIYE